MSIFNNEPVDAARAFDDVKASYGSLTAGELGGMFAAANSAHITRVGPDVVLSDELTNG